MRRDASALADASGWYGGRLPPRTGIGACRVSWWCSARSVRRIFMTPVIRPNARRVPRRVLGKIDKGVESRLLILELTEEWRVTLPPSYPCDPWFDFTSLIRSESRPWRQTKSRDLTRGGCRPYIELITIWCVSYPEWLRVGPDDATATGSPAKVDAGANSRPVWLVWSEAWLEAKRHPKEQRRWGR